MRGADQNTVKIERRLRRDSTIAEMRLWFSLRDRRLNGFKFVRQEAIDRYVVDFACRDKMLVIEIDGSQHADSESDKLRDAALAEMGYRVMRFWNSDVLANKHGVLTAIVNALKTNDLPLTRSALCADHPLPAARGEGKSERLSSSRKPARRRRG
jgi:very-short-patch-repair endonuclease